MTKTIRALSCILTASAWLLLTGGAVLARQPEEAPRVAGEPYRVGGGVTRPEKIAGSPPVYTEMARKAKVMGVVIVEAIIDEEGNVTNSRVLKGLPMGLDRSAQEAIETWKFKPATFEGRPVRVYYVLTVNFKVEDGPFLSPLFGKFMTDNPEFAELVRNRQYQEAAELLDRWGAKRPTDSAITLARSSLFLMQGRLNEAWEEARSYRGPEPYDVLFSVGSFAQSRLAHDRNLVGEQRAEVIETGLQALDMAMAARRSSPAAPYLKAQLLREKVELTMDPAARQSLRDEIGDLEKLLADLEAAGQAPKKPQQ